MRKILWAWPVFLLALGACGGSKEANPENDPGLQMATQVTLFESKDSQKKWTLETEEVDFSDLNSAILKNPILFFKEEGKDTGKVTGDYGTFDYNKRLVSIRGNARVESLKDKVLIVSEEIFYDVKNDRVWSEQKTTVTRGTGKITAKGGVETDSKLATIELIKQSTKLPLDVKELKP